MKPRIRWDSDCWLCVGRGNTGRGTVGFGKTPEAAYLEWIRQQNRQMQNAYPQNAYSEDAGRQFQSAWFGYFGDAGGPLC